MPDQHVKIVKNSLSAPCLRCTAVHDFITKLSKDAPCNTPVGFSAEYAAVLVDYYKMNQDDIINATDDTVVVLHESARKLPTDSGVTQLAQFNLEDKLM